MQCTLEAKHDGSHVICGPKAEQEWKDTSDSKGS